jgi:hypothetical protein
MKKVVILFTLAALLLLPLTAADGDFDLDLDVGIDYQNVEGRTLVGVNLQPDISIGKFGFGLKGSLFFEIGADGGLLTFNPENWIPVFEPEDTLLDKVKTTAGIYLPIFRYARYGFKGDPLHARIGQLDGSSLGTGMFVNSYSNTLFLPNKPLVGAILDVDGRLFNFPYIGFEGMTGNLAEFDLMAGRLYTRPLAFVDFPVIRDIQVGASYAVDTDPALYYSGEESFTPKPVSMYGVDIILPIVDASLARLRLFGDYGIQPDPQGINDEATGLRGGFDGHILGFLSYGANVLLPTNNYKPDYFNTSYDLYREDRYTDPGMDSDNFFFNGSLGFNLLDDALVFDLSVSSEIENNSGTYNVTNPMMTAKFSLGEELLGFVYFDAFYRKQFSDSEMGVPAFFYSILSLDDNSEIRANVSVKYNIFVIDTGYVITFQHDGTMNAPDVTVGGKVKLL